jgi:hypothetical protein
MRIVISALAMVLFVALSIGCLACLLFLAVTADRWVLGRLSSGVALYSGGGALLGAVLLGWLAWHIFGRLRAAQRQ